MTKTDQEKIWQKFYRKDTKIEGFGVGLYLVKRIIDMYGWTIEIESKKGEYTQFNIYFNNK